MAVKLVVIYPRPKDVEAFETVYNRDHAQGGRETCRQNQDCRDQGTRFSGGRTSVAPHR